MSEESKTPYRVLARKYRPQNFDELIGQDALVRTLKNAIESNRIAHAYMLTGIRGTGKTTTARIIAKALNYTGADGKSGPTTGPTDDCDICNAITEDRHPDVLEMDAASRTGIDDIREIIDGVRYAPGQARYKIYIIDEVHMLSRNAFNALLKTLEEPPEHVIFIFATTEIRKVPVTVLSRCQRFDLRRIDAETLGDYYKQICEKEGVKVEDEAVAMIARSADGSVRDGLSLLDQAIALGGGNDITVGQVKDMLGIADRALVMDLLEHSLKGECPQALELIADLHNKGAGPATLIQDLLDSTHLLTKLRAVPKLEDSRGSAVSADMVARSRDLASQLSMPTLGRAWQILLKGVTEINQAPNTQAALEMVVIRLSYAADLPDPGALLKRLKDGDTTSSTQAPAVPVAASAETRQPEPVAVQSSSGGAAVAVAATEPVVEAQPVTSEQLQSLQDVVSFLEQKREMILAGQICHYVHLVTLKKGHLEVRIEPEADKQLSQNLRNFLIKETGDQWMISISDKEGEKTLAEQIQAKSDAEIAAAKQNPLVHEVLTLFPGTKIEIIDIVDEEQQRKETS